MHVLDSLAAFILVLITSLLGSQPLSSVPPPAGWELEQSWTSQPGEGNAKSYVFTVSSRTLPEECHRNPKAYVVFPTIMQASHLIRFDGHLAQSFGDANFERTSAIYGSPFLRCADLANTTLLTWTVIAHSKFFAQVKAYPSLSPKMPFGHFFHETLYIAAAGVTFILMLISLIIFAGKVSNPLFVRMVAASFTSCLYFVCSYPLAWHLELSLLMAHKLMIASIWSSIWLINGIFYERGLVARRLFNTYSGFIFLTVIMAIFGSSEETTHAGSMMSFAMNVLVTLIVFVSLLRRFCRERTRQNFLQMCSGSFFIFSVINDIFFLMRTPIINLMTLPIGIVAGQLFLLLSINEEILETYERKRDLEESLKISEREKLAAQYRIEVNATIAKASQMLVHDIKKPFAVLDGFIRLVLNASKPEMISRYAEKYLPFIRTSMLSVHRLLEELTEIGRPANLKCEAIVPGQLLLTALQEVLSICPNQREFTTLFKLTNTHKAYADPHQIRRVVCNIIQNAFEAAESLSCMSFSCVEHKEHLVFTIENDGSFITAENRLQVFRAFYTSGKRNGTGLGLAISQKIISDHGGSIWCESDEEAARVRFNFTLPKTTLRCIDRHAYPMSSIEIINQAVCPVDFGQSKFYDSQLQRFQKTFLRQISLKNRKYEVVLIEDDLMYIDYINEVIAASKLLGSHINLATYSCAASFLTAMAASKLSPDLFICDIDLGSDAIDGFGVTTAIRQAGYKNLICVHSNATSAAFYKQAITAGADFFFIKPIQEVHFLKLLAASEEKPPMKKAGGENVRA